MMRYQPRRQRQFNPDHPTREKTAPDQPECWQCAHCVTEINGPYCMLSCSLLPDFRPFGYHWGACRRFEPNRKIIYCVQKEPVQTSPIVRIHK